MLSRLKQQESSIEELSTAWLHRDGEARAMVDETLRLVWANKSMIEMMRSFRDIFLINGSIAINSAENQAKFVDFVQECGTNLSTMLLSDRMSGHFIFQGQLVGRSEGRHFVGLKIRYTAQFKPYYVDLGAAFGLTRMEHRVLLQMLDGRMADEISVADGTSIGTVRTHIRHIYEKMQVTSREGLFSLVAPYRL